LFVSLISWSQINVFGVHGLVKIPDAYVTNNGKGFIAYNYFDDYRATSVLTKTRFSTFSLGAGLHSRLEAGIRLVTFTEFGGNNHDRNLNVKWVVFPEKGEWPQMAVGSQDLIGTKRFHAEYVVFSKTLAMKPWHVVPTAGYAVKWIEKFTGDKAGDHRLNGFFTGLSGDYRKIFFIMLDYDGTYWNMAVQWRFRDFLQLTTFTDENQYYGIHASVMITL
jgi:hypothetical protein